MASLRSKCRFGLIVLAHTGADTQLPLSASSRCRIMLACIRQGTQKDKLLVGAPAFMRGKELDSDDAFERWQCFTNSVREGRLRVRLVQTSSFSASLHRSRQRARRRFSWEPLGVRPNR